MTGMFCLAPYTSAYCQHWIFEFPTPHSQASPCLDQQLDTAWTCLDMLCTKMCWKLAWWRSCKCKSRCWRVTTSNRMPTKPCLYFPSSYSKSCMDYGLQEDPVWHRMSSFCIFVCFTKILFHVNIHLINSWTIKSPTHIVLYFTIILDIYNVLLLMLLLLKCAVSDASITRVGVGILHTSGSCFLTEIIEMVIRLPHLQVEW